MSEPAGVYTRIFICSVAGNPVQYKSPVVGLGNTLKFVYIFSGLLLPVVVTHTVLHFSSLPYWLLTVRHTWYYNLVFVKSRSVSVVSGHIET